MRRHAVAAWFALAAVGCASAATSQADGSEAHAHVERHADGKAGAPGRFAATSSHPFDDVAHWVRIFDADSRDAWQQVDRVVAALGDLDGRTVCDVGAGTGHFLAALDAAVGARGTVVAIETEPNLVAHIRERAELEGLDRVVPVLTSFDRLRVGIGTCDVVFLVNTYHHLDQRHVYLDELKYFFTPVGRLVVIDWRTDQLDVGPALDHRIARDAVLSELSEIGYRIVAEHSFLRYQYFLVATP